VLDEKMKDEVKITVIATGFREVRPRREHSEPATALHNARASAASVNATYEVTAMRETKTPTPEHIKTPEPEMPAPERPRAASYLPDNFAEIDSEIVRHAEPLEETLRRQNAAPEAMDTVSSSVEIRYDTDDLEIPAFLRKRAEG